MRLTIALTLAVSCGTEPIDRCVTHCGVHVSAHGSLAYPCAEYRAAELALLQEIPSLSRACLNWSGVVAWEEPGESSVVGGVLLPDGGVGNAKVGGYSECWNGRLFFHSGDGVFKSSTNQRHAWHTAFPHELIHVAQWCDAPRPVDEGADPSHANWIRADLMNAPSRVVRRLDGAP